MDASALKASDDGLRRLHTHGELGLREASLGTGLDQQASQLELWSKLLVRGLVLWCLELLLVQVIDTKVFIRFHDIRPAGQVLSRFPNVL